MISFVVTYVGSLYGGPFALCKNFVSNLFSQKICRIKVFGNKHFNWEILWTWKKLFSQKYWSAIYFLQEKISRQILFLLCPNTPAKWFPLKCEKKSCCIFICCMFAFHCRFLSNTNMSSLTFLCFASYRRSLSLNNSHEFTIDFNKDDYKRHYVSLRERKPAYCKRKRLAMIY